MYNWIRIRIQKTGDITGWVFCDFTWWGKLILSPLLIILPIILFFMLCLMKTENL